MRRQSSSACSALELVARLIGEPLDHDAAGAPVRAVDIGDPVDRDLEFGLELLALPEIGLHAIGERRAAQLDNALIRLAELVLVDRERETTVAEQGLHIGPGDARQARLVVARIAAHGALVGAVGQHQRHGAVALDLQAEGAVELEAARKRRGEHEQLAEHTPDRLGIVVPRQHAVDQGAEADHPAAQRRTLQLERPQEIVGDQTGAHPLTPAALSRDTTPGCPFAHAGGFPPDRIPPSADCRSPRRRPPRRDAPADNA